MKIKSYLILFAIIICASCKKDAIDSTVSTTGITYQQSLSNWQSFKQSVNNNYSYTVTFGSWVGFSTSTKLTVRNGVVTARDYNYYVQTPGTGILTLTKSWSETAATLNTHGQYEGAAILTLDEVYAKAKSNWLAADKSKNTVYFETKNNGMISSAGYVPNGCQDDCFNGITIKEIVGN